MTDALPLSLPQRAEDITPERISQALAPRFPGARARSVEIVDAHSGTTGRARLRVDWEKSAGAPEALFAKLAPTDEIQRQMVIATGMGKREAQFYASLTDDVPVRSATAYASEWNDEGSAYLMLIEDLAAVGCRFPSWQDPGAPEVIGGMMDTLAKLHAGFWESPRLAGDLDWIEPPMRSDFGPLLVKAAMEEHKGAMPAAFRAIGEIYTEHTEALSDLLDEGPQTLLHGDSHLGNLFLETRDGRDEVGLLDWACTARGPGLRDVAYFLCNSVDPALRRERERDWLSRYLGVLAEAGAPAPSFDEAFARYRRLAVTAWIAATATVGAGSRMQSLDIGMRSMRRATGAIIELEVVELLRDELGLP